MKAIVFKDDENFNKAISIIIDADPETPLTNHLERVLGDNALILEEKEIEYLKNSGLEWREEDVE